MIHLEISGPTKAGKVGRIKERIKEKEDPKSARKEKRKDKDRASSR